MIKLIGILIVVVGFALKFNSIAIVMVAGFVTAMVGGISIIGFLETLGSTFIANRYMALFMLTVPVIAFVERNGLKIVAAKAIGKLKGATPVKVIMSYGVVRAVFAAFNVSFGGVAGFVRPIITPMAVGAIKKDGQEILEKDEEDIKGMGAAIENVAWFFGQVLFLAGAGLLLVKGTLDPMGYEVDPVTAVKAQIPVLIFGLIVAGIYFFYIERKMLKNYKNVGKDKGGKQ
jgi:uncharacterized membrane protein